MTQDATKVLLETTTSSFKVVSNFDADPEVFVAGLAVRAADDSGLQLEDDSTAALVGISLGRSLDKSDRTAVVRKGDSVPLRMKQYYASGNATITAFANLLVTAADTIEVAGVVFTAQSGAATLGTATFRAATSDTATAASLAAQINAHATTSALVTAVAAAGVVTITADAPGTGGNALTLVYTDNGAEVGATISAATLEDGAATPAIVGKKVYVNDDGLGCASTDGDAAATSGIYESVLLTGVDTATDTEVAVALVDMPGGL